MKDFTKQQLLETRFKNVSPSFLKTDINRWNIRFALALSVFTFFAGLAGSLGALLLEVLFLLLVMPIIVKKYKIITFTEDKKFLDMNKDEIPTNRELQKEHILLSTVLTVVMIFFLINMCSFITLSLCIINTPYLLLTFICISKNLPIFIIFHPEFQKKFNTRSRFHSLRDNPSLITSPRYSYLPQNIYHRR